MNLTQVIQCVKDDVKALEPFDVELGLLDVSVDGCYVDVRVEGSGRLSCDLA